MTLPNTSSVQRSVLQSESAAPSAPAILMVSMEPPAAMEDEFNDWYDTEHFPQRSALPGVQACSRWVCLDGWPRWMALYGVSAFCRGPSDVHGSWHNSVGASPKARQLCHSRGSQGFL